MAKAELAKSYRIQPTVERLKVKFKRIDYGTIWTEDTRLKPGGIQFARVWSLVFGREGGRIRTCDQRIKSPVLYRLSYTPV